MVRGFGAQLANDTPIYFPEMVGWNLLWHRLHSFSTCKGLATIPISRLQFSMISSIDSSPASLRRTQNDPLATRRGSPVDSSPGRGDIPSAGTVGAALLSWWCNQKADHQLRKSPTEIPSHKSCCEVQMQMSPNPGHKDRPLNINR